MTEPDYQDIAACGFTTNDHVVVSLQNDVPMTRRPHESVTLVLNSQPLQYKGFSQVMHELLRSDELRTVHVQVGRKFLRECRSMGRWRHIERVFDRRNVQVSFGNTNNNPLAMSGHPEIARFRDFLRRGAISQNDGTYCHVRPTASRRRRVLSMVFTCSENLV